MSVLNFYSAHENYSNYGGCNNQRGVQCNNWGHLSGSPYAIVAQMRWDSNAAAGSSSRRHLGDYIPNISDDNFVSGITLHSDRIYFPNLRQDPPHESLQ